MKRLILIFAILTLTACAAPQPTQQSFIPNEKPTPTPTESAKSTPTHIPVDLTPAQRAAISSLSETLNLPAAKITLVSTESVTWRDGCLGVVKIGVLCTQAEVPGFKIILEAGDKQYEFHTNQDGSSVAQAVLSTFSSAIESSVTKQLAKNLGLKESAISVVSDAAIEFPDSCLGVAMPDVMCSQIVTPGRSIVLEAKGIQYEYHTNEDGSEIQPATFALTWTRSGGIAGFCDSMTVFLSGEVYGQQCKPDSKELTGTFADLLSANERDQFTGWMAKFSQASLDASDPAGVSDRMTRTLILYGTGNSQPTKADQAALFSWAQGLFQKLSQ